MQTDSEFIVNYVGFLVVTLFIAGIGLVFVLRPDIVDAPNDSWWGKFAKRHPEEKESRYRQHRKSGKRLLLLTLIPIAILIFLLPELIAKLQ